MTDVHVRVPRRHAMLVDQRTEGVVVPLNLTLDCSGKLELANSSLSEMAVLGVRTTCDGISGWM